MRIPDLILKHLRAALVSQQVLLQTHGELFLVLFFSRWSRRHC